MALTMQIFSIGIVFSAISPLVLPLLLVYFYIMKRVWIYQLIYVYDRPFELGGRWFKKIHTYFYAAMLLFQGRTKCESRLCQLNINKAALFFVSRRIARRIHEISDPKKSSRAQSSGRMHEIPSVKKKKNTEHEKT